jgi:FtsZ-binding cell division protein ZapB
MTDTDTDNQFYAFLATTFAMVISITIIHMFAEQVASLKKENDALKEKNDALKEENGELKKENGELKKENGELKKENGELKEKISVLLCENEDLKKEIIGAYCELSVIQYELAMETEQKEHMKETFLSIKDVVETNAPHIKAPINGMIEQCVNDTGLKADEYTDDEEPFDDPFDEKALAREGRKSSL